MCGNGQVKRSQSIAAERVCSALKNDGRRSEGCDGRFHDGLEERDVALVVDSILQRYIETEVLAQAVADLVDRACAGEEVAVELVEGYGQDPIGQIERLLNSVPVVDVDINVEDSRMKPGEDIATK